MSINPQYDYDYLDILAPLQVRATHPDLPYMIAPPVGWVDLVLDLDAKLSLFIPDYTIAQVKEKFAGLRYYIGDYGVPRGAPEVGWAQHFIADAEAQSQTMCQICGEPATMRMERSYYATLCDPHNNIISKWRLDINQP
jgi:hypothetical protein